MKSAKVRLVCAVGIALFAARVSFSQQFTDQTATRFPAMPSEYSNQVAIADADGDGDLDVAFANGGNFSSAGPNQVLRLLINDGTGNFSDESAARIGFSGLCRDVEFGDVDNDGDLDLLAAQDFARQPKLFINDGSGFFSDQTATRLPTILLGSSHVALGDVDNDGDLDLWFTNGGASRFGSGQAQLFINDGTGVFTNGTSTHLPLILTSQPSDCIFGDIDGDFDLDMMEGHLGSNNSRLYVNDGSGNFTEDTSYPSDSSCYSYDFGDLDGDGDLDLLGANGGSGVREIVCVGDGFGNYTNTTDATIPLSSNPSVDDNDSKFFDFDDDGDLDMVIARIGGPERVLVNNSSVFTTGSGILPSISDSTLDLEVGDLNLDGRIDLVTAQGESGAPYTNRIYINSGPLDSRAPSFPQIEQIPDVTGGNAGPYVFRVIIRDDMTSDHGFHRAASTFSYSVNGGAPVVLELFHAGHDLFRGVIPTQPAGSVVTYSASAEDLAGNVGSSATLSFSVVSAIPTFKRGDCNGDGGYDISDPVALLHYMFVQVGGSLDCQDACDPNDDNMLTLADPLGLLAFLFTLGPAPVAPFPACGLDGGVAECDVYDACP